MMATGDVSPTKMELLNVNEKLVLARKGHEMLKKKRDSLIREQADAARELKGYREDLHILMKKCHDEGKVAATVTGEARFYNAAREAGKRLEVHVNFRKTAGVNVPVLDAVLTDAGRGLRAIDCEYDDLGGLVDDYRSMVLRVVRLAALEKKTAVIGAEIRRTRRKVNALEKVKIVGLAEKKAYISEYLSEAEREDYARLKHIKEALLREAEGL